MCGKEFDYARMLFINIFVSCIVPFSEAFSIFGSNIGLK